MIPIDHAARAKEKFLILNANLYTYLAQYIHRVSIKQCDQMSYFLKIAKNVAQPIIFVKINAKLLPWKQKL
jgi:hypothetical protein